MLICLPRVTVRAQTHPLPASHRQMTLSRCTGAGGVSLLLLLIVCCFSNPLLSHARRHHHHAVHSNDQPQLQPQSSAPDVQGTVPVYTVTDFTTQSIGFTAQLVLSNPGAGTYGPAITALQLTAVYETDSRVHFRLTDASRVRYEVPQSVLPYPQPGSHDFPAPGSPGSYDPDFPMFKVTTSAVGEQLSLSVKRTQDGTTLFELGALEYSDQYLQLTNMLPPEDSPTAPLLYGIGEHVMEFQLPTDDHLFTMWNVDSNSRINASFAGKGKGQLHDAPYDKNVYGTHPFYVQTLADSGLAHGMFVRASNGMEVVTSKTQVQFRIIGGVLDWYVFVGPGHEQVIQQFQSVIGRPHFPPYWSLGWHQCRWGVENLTELKGVVEAYHASNIPLETIWSDIDYMDAFEDFSWDPINYPLADVQAFKANLTAMGMRYVVIVDPGIHNRVGYPAYDQLLAAKAYITTGDGVTPFVGDVWPGPTVFPDFLNPAAHSYWADQIAAFLSQVNYDGLWIDMNEISNFHQLNPAPYNASNPVNNPPYVLNNYGFHLPLNTMTIPSDALHMGGTYSEYDVHNLYGMTESIATRAGLEKAQGVRSFVLSRSTFAGSGAHAAHWLGDNHATWDDMRWSIAGVLSMNMFGIPLVGADTCGFLGNVTEELCLRWSAMNGFSPFARNHHDGQPGNQPHQEPYQWESVAAVSRRVLGLRYSLLPYLYTLFHRVHVAGGTVARSLMFNFPQDAETYPIGEQFMWSSGLLITPVLTEGADSVKGYFPSTARWFDAFNLTELIGAGGWREIPCSLEEGVAVHFAGGHIIPTQSSSVMTTVAGRQTPFGLTILPNNDGQAVGELFWDSGADLVPEANSLEVSFSASVVQGQGVSWTVTRNTFSGELPPLASLSVAGFDFEPKSIVVNGNPLAEGSWTLDQATAVLQVTGLKLSFNAPATIQWL